MSDFCGIAIWSMVKVKINLTIAFLLDNER